MELTYGLINQNNILVNSVIIDNANLSILDSLLSIHNAIAAYPFNMETDIVSVGETKWNGVDWEPKKAIPKDTRYVDDIIEESLA